MGLHYLTLHRSAPTLSGGEAQRIRLASQIGCGLVGVLYILDEPETALSPKSQLELLELLKEAGDVGQAQFIIATHSPIVLACPGARILTCQHAFGGVGRAVRKKLGTYQTEEIMAFTLRTFCEGIKVAAEMCLMAADAGLVRTDSPLVAIAGTGRGADTAAILKP